MASTAGSLAARADELASRREPFVHATVVRAQRPTSAHAGDTALVLPNREALVRRLAVGLGVASLYGRYMHFSDAMSDEHVIQIGLLLKLPLKTFGGRR